MAPKTTTTTNKTIIQEARNEEEAVPSDWESVMICPNFAQAVPFSPSTCPFSSRSTRAPRWTRLLETLSPCASTRRSQKTNSRIHSITNCLSQSCLLMTAATPSTTTSRKKAPLSPARLGLVFDIDGTLIAQPAPNGEIVFRHGTIEFLADCLAAGHGLALWTAGNKTWAARVAAVLCTRVQAHRQKQRRQDKQTVPHVCNDPYNCQETFSFVWDCRQLEHQEAANKGPKAISPRSQCMFCGPYAQECTYCPCVVGGNKEECRCRSIKPLRKVWECPPDARFAVDSVLMIENTPEECIINMDNSIFVPTYRPGSPHESIWKKLAKFLQTIPEGTSVRDIVKCNHGNEPHACRMQAWW